jgi:hypothetical protein
MKFRKGIGGYEVCISQIIRQKTNLKCRQHILRVIIQFSNRNTETITNEKSRIWAELKYVSQILFYHTPVPICNSVNMVLHGRAYICDVISVIQTQTGRFGPKPNRPQSKNRPLDVSALFRETFRPHYSVSLDWLTTIN